MNRPESTFHAYPRRYRTASSQNPPTGPDGLEAGNGLKKASAASHDFAGVGAGCRASLCRTLPRVARTDPEYPSWPCMICCRFRLFDEISVAHRPLPAEYADMAPHANVSYCNDNLACITAANTHEPWLIIPDAA